MDNWLALALIVILLFRLAILILPQRQKLRFRALLDVGAGTLMTILFVLFAWRRAWLWATLFGIISIPSWRALWAGLVTLARTPPR